MDLTVVLLTGAVSGLCSVVFTVAAFRILKSRLERWFGAVASGFVSVMLADLAKEPEKYAQTIVPLLEKLEPTAVAMIQKNLSQVLGGGDQGAVGGFLPKKWRWAEPLLMSFLQGQAQKTATAAVANSFP